MQAIGFEQAWYSGRASTLIRNLLACRKRIKMATRGRIEAQPVPHPVVVTVQLQEGRCVLEAGRACRHWYRQSCLHARSMDERGGGLAGEAPAAVAVATVAVRTARGQRLLADKSLLRSLVSVSCIVGAPVSSCAGPAIGRLRDVVVGGRQEQRYPAVKGLVGHRLRAEHVRPRRTARPRRNDDVRLRSAKGYARRLRASSRRGAPRR